MDSYHKNYYRRNYGGKNFIEPVLERRGIVIMTRIDVKLAFDAASWTTS